MPPKSKFAIICEISSSPSIGERCRKCHPAQELLRRDFHIYGASKQTVMLYYPRAGASPPVETHHSSLCVEEHHSPTRVEIRHSPTRVGMSSLSVVDTADSLALLRNLRESAQRIGIGFFTALFELAPTLDNIDHEEGELNHHLDLLKKLVTVEVRVPVDVASYKTVFATSSFWVLHTFVDFQSFRLRYKT